MVRTHHATHNRHHLIWPRRDYKTPVERAFRNLSCNIVWMEIEAHKELHATTKPPKKPKLKLMVEAINQHKQGKCPTCQGGEPDATRQQLLTL